MESMPKDEHRGPTILGSTGSMVFLGVLLCILRLWARMPRFGMTFGWDDYFIIIAVLVSLVQWGLTAAIVSNGYGRHIVYLNDDQLMRINKYQFISFILWGWSIAFPKISISCLLLRLKRDTPAWKSFLFSMIALQICSAIVCTVLVLIIVNPIAAYWNPKAYSDAKWLKPEVTQNGLYFLAAVNILTDLLLSLLPITFISRMRQPLRTRIAISCVMALGLLTTAIAAYRTYLVWAFSKREITDPTWDNAQVTIMAVLEAALAIIAACIPCLKRPFELVFKKMATASQFSIGSIDSSSTNVMRSPGCKEPVLRPWHNPEDQAILGGSRSNSGVRCDSEKELHGLQTRPESLKLAGSLARKSCV